MSNPIVQFNEEAVKGELKDLVRTGVEETLNELLNKEAEELTSAAKYERTKSRHGYRSGHYSRKLTTTSGEVRLEVPKLKAIHAGRNRPPSPGLRRTSSFFRKLNLRKILDSTV